jgi:hypothetical protein
MILSLCSKPLKVLDRFGIFYAPDACASMQAGISASESIQITRILLTLTKLER